jgi:hypothetical protein
MTNAAVGREDLERQLEWLEHSRLERWKACSVRIR